MLTYIARSAGHATISATVANTELFLCAVPPIILPCIASAKNLNAKRLIQTHPAFTDSLRCPIEHLTTYIQTSSGTVFIKIICYLLTLTPCGQNRLPPWQINFTVVFEAVISKSFTQFCLSRTSLLSITWSQLFSSSFFGSITSMYIFWSSSGDKQRAETVNDRSLHRRYARRALAS